MKQSIQQKEAEKYIKDIEKNLGFEINELYLTGHSLGGNLALFSSFVLSKELREKLVTATTFNAPGFNLKTLAYYKEAIDELNKSGKITEFQNRYDVVPAFMQNPSIGVLIDSTSSKGNFSSDHHSMFNLKQEDGIFARSESQTREPHTVFVYRFSMNFESIPDFLMSGLIETISDVVGANEFKLSDIPKIITAVGTTPTLLTIVIATVIETINDVVKDEIKRKLLQTAVQVTLAVVRAKQSYDNFTNNLKREAFKKGVEFTIGLAKAHQEYTRIRDELRSKLLQRGVEFVVDIIKAHLAWKRFKDNLRSKVIQKGVEAVFTLAKANQAWNSFKEGLKRKALQKSVKFTISLIKSKQSSGYSKLLGNTVNLVKKLTVRLIRGSAKASKGPRIIANVDRLLALQKSIQRNADTVAQLVRQIQSIASNINSNVGRRFHEWYVQSQIRQIENQLAQVRKVEREASGKLQSLSEGVRFSVQKYRQVEAQLQFKS